MFYQRATHALRVACIHVVFPEPSVSQERFQYPYPYITQIGGGAYRAGTNLESAKIACYMYL